MSLLNVLIENWPRLQCVNIVLMFDSEAAVQQAQLKLTANNLHITFGAESASFPFPPSLCVNVDTISQLVKDANYLSFRLATNRAHAFDEEYLCQKMPSARINGPSRMKLQPSVLAEQRVLLQCTFCGHALSNDVAFQRVLELPSDNLDSDEWFCHHPSKGHSHGHGHHVLEEIIDESPAIQSNLTKMMARPLDLLYGQFFFVVNAEQLSGIQLVRDVVKCPQCYRKLGEFYIKNGTAKLWNELVSFRTSGRQLEIDDSNLAKPLFDGNLFDQFLFIIRKVIEDFDFLWSTEALPQTTRCLFEAQHSTETRTFLLVNVITKELEMWLSESPDDPKQLGRVNGMKVLYQTIDTDVPVAAQSLISSWMEDSTVNHIRISTAMMTEALNELDERMLLMPKCYRQALKNGFRMSYLYESKVLNNLKE